MFLRIFALAFAALTALPAAAQTFTFAAIGDTPYFLPGDHERLARVIAEINRRAPAFTIHVGDIKSGSTRCDDAVFERVQLHFAAFEQPLIYTPGDNEWTDCHRANNGGYDPIERLATIRRMFFRDDFSLGRTRLPVVRQGADPRFARFVENFRWVHNNVVFVTLHVIGSSNNLQRNRAAIEEYIERNEANLAWLRAAFAEAAAQNRAAVVIAMQADMDFDQAPDRRPGFNDTLAALQEGTIAFGRPVLLIHGDSHYFRVDQPMQGGVSRRLVDNFTRLEVYGERDVHAVLVTVDPADATSPWSFRPMLVRENFNDQRRPPN